MIKRTKLTIVLINLIIILFLISSTASATLIDEFEKSIDTSGSSDLKTTGGKIVGIIQVVGTMVSVGMLIVLGIKYMMGSADQKAEYRKSMFPYFIGAILIFAATNLADVIYEWAKAL